MSTGLVRVGLLSAALAGLLAPAQAGQATGSIAGTVTLSAARGSPLSTSVYGRRGVAPKPAAAGPEALKVVVYLQGASPATRPDPTKAVIAQRGEQFEPPVTVVTVGSAIDFPNKDPFFHNVFSLSRVATFDLGRYPSGESRTLTLSRPGIVKVFCQLHAQMSALIVVLDHPWFTIPQETGAFTLPDVPAREHTLVAWHERIGERRERIRVSSGDTTRVSFTLPVLNAQP